jgi:hypothetical protein
MPKIYTTEQLDEMYSKVQDLVINGKYSLSVSCEMLGFNQAFLRNPRLAEKRKELVKIHAIRPKTRKRKKADEFIIPQKSPFKKEYRPKLTENNYLV